jgi:hypothetical protein
MREVPQGRVCALRRCRGCAGVALLRALREFAGCLRHEPSSARVRDPPRRDDKRKQQQQERQDCQDCRAGGSPPSLRRPPNPANPGNPVSCCCCCRLLFLSAQQMSYVSDFVKSLHLVRLQSPSSRSLADARDDNRLTAPAPPVGAPRCGAARTSLLGTPPPRGRSRPPTRAAEVLRRHGMKSPRDSRTPAALRAR